MTRIEDLDGCDSATLARVLSLTAALLVGCASEVDLGGSVSPPDPVSDPHELSAQTTNLAQVNAHDFSSLAIDGEFLYFSSGGSASGYRLWRCRKSDCWTTLVGIASLDSPWSLPALGLNGGRLGWPNGMCDAPDCANRVSFGFPIWDRRFGYWFDGLTDSIYRCEIPNCFVGTGVNKTWSHSSLVASRAQPTDFKLAADRLYWLDLIEGITRASTDGATPAERLSLGPVTEWTASRAGLQLDGAGDVTVIDIELDGAYVYAALKVGNQNANATLGCDTCAAGIAIARWQHASPGAAREWVLMNDEDLTDLSHLRVYGGEVIWGSANGNLWSCLASDCATSKRQIGVNDATFKVAPLPPVDRSRADLLQPQAQFIAVDEQAIFWLSVPCNPTLLECAPTGSRNWTLKRTPRIAQ